MENPEICFRRIEVRPRVFAQDVARGFCRKRVEDRDGTGFLLKKRFTLGTEDFFDEVGIGLVSTLGQAGESGGGLEHGGL